MFTEPGYKVGESRHEGKTIAHKGLLLAIG
jgi:hypothetical protein